MDILNIKNKSLRHAVTSLISVIVSTLRGIEYLTAAGTDTSVLDKVIKVFFFLCRFLKNKTMEVLLNVFALQFSRNVQSKKV